MKTTKEQRAELRARTPTSQQSMYQLYVRRAELHAVLDDLDEAEARAERLSNNLAALLREVHNEAVEKCAKTVWHRDEQDRILALRALDETANKTSEANVAAMVGNVPTVRQNLASPEIATSATRVPGTDSEEPGSPSGECPGCAGTSIMHHPDVCALLQKKWADAFGTDPPATSTPDDDAARAAREWLREWFHCGYENNPHKVAALVTRDAQVREAGRVEGWSEAANHMERGWGSSTHADVLREARDAKYGKRPDRAKGGGER